VWGPGFKNSVTLEKIGRILPVIRLSSLGGWGMEQCFPSVKVADLPRNQHTWCLGSSLLFLSSLQLHHSIPSHLTFHTECHGVSLIFLSIDFRCHQKVSQWNIKTDSQSNSNESWFLSFPLKDPSVQNTVQLLSIVGDIFYESWERLILTSFNSKTGTQNKSTVNDML
jgi:hypothetical protein